MVSQDHVESVARTIAVLREVREQTDDEWAQERLDKAEDVCWDYLLRADHPADAIPENVDVDPPTLRNAVIAIDAVQSRVSVVERAALADARGLLDERQEVTAE